MPLAQHRSETNEWYTPPVYIEAARHVMGGIDLDPASCAAANEVIQATDYYGLDKGQDALTSCWHGRVWLNPPYGKTANKSNAGIFVRYLLDQYRAGHVEQACVLVGANTAQAWFQPLWSYPLCFVARRIKFWQPGRTQDQPPSATVIAYLGPKANRFADTFRQFGPIIWMVLPQQEARHATVADRA